MSNQTENLCWRGRKDCTPTANTCSDTVNQHNTPDSFVCVGWNRPQDRFVQADRFTLCWKNNAIDERGHWDKRDLLATMSVIAQALSTDENVRINEGIDELGMQEVNMVG